MGAPAGDPQSGYDAIGRLVRVIDALGQITQYAYDEVGNRITQTDANGHTTSFAYDMRGRQTKRSLPDGASESKTYDAAGEVLTRVDFLGRSTNYAYDPMGRMLSRTYPDASSVSFTYTPLGQRATAKDARGTTAYTYDARQRLAKLVYPDGRELDYGYDAAGDRTALTAKIGSGSWTTTTAYDALGRVSGVTDLLARTTSFTYDASSARTALAYPNGVTTHYAYDTRGRLTGIAAVTTSATVASFAYTLDATGNRTRIDEADGTTRKYGYDAIDRLTSESVTGSLSYAKTFAYDPVGNRSAQVTTGSGAANVSYSYDTRDRLTSESGATYAYDANGNVTSKSGEATYAWDFENRLVSVTMANGTVVRHVYDADGNRVQTTTTPSTGATTVTNMLVDTSGGLSHVVAETDASNALTALYIRAGDELLAVMRPGAGWTSRYVTHDAIGSVRALTDEAGVVADTRGYEAFGTMNAEAGSDPLPYRFAGEAFDSASRLAYHRARWMDARVGRFVSTDPFAALTEECGCSALYVYANARPLYLTDPSGLVGIEDSQIAGIGNAILSLIRGASFRGTVRAVMTVAFIGASVQSSDDPNLVPAIIGTVAPEFKWIRGAGGLLKSVGLIKAAQLGERIGAELAKLPTGKMQTLASNVSSLGLIQSEAAEATAAAIKAMGLRSARIAAGTDVIVASVVQGAGKPVLRVAVDGTVTRATADLGVEGGQFVARNIQNLAE